MLRRSNRHSALQARRSTCSKSRWRGSLKRRCTVGACQAPAPRLRTVLMLCHQYESFCSAWTWYQPAIRAISLVQDIEVILSTEVHHSGAPRAASGMCMGRRLVSSKMVTAVAHCPE